MATSSATTTPVEPDMLGRQDRTLLLFARLMEGGQEDEETCRDLDALTKMLDEEVDAVKNGEKAVTEVIDGDCFDTIVCYLDMRNADMVRGHATLTTSAYLKAAGNEGKKKLSDFFRNRVQRGTYDDFIVAFCVASAVFPIVPDAVAELFLIEGFLGTLGPLMRRKWKSRKVETACLEMLNAACMHTNCREAVRKYCSDWLEEIVDQDPEDVVRAMYAADPDVNMREGSVSMRRHSEHVQNLAAVVLTKIRAVEPANEASTGSRVQEATTSIESLSNMFTNMLMKDGEHTTQNSIEGLAYASLQPRVRDKLSKDKEFLGMLVKTLATAPPKSPLTYGALSILANLTRYQPNLSEEEKRMKQLKAYANAAGQAENDPLMDDQHVAERCRRVFEAGLTPVLVSHSKNGSVASLSLIISIIFSLSVTTQMRGQLAQQGAIRLLQAAWTALPDGESETRRKAAQALARMLISTNPTHVFGGTRPIPQSSAIRPLTSLLKEDAAVSTRDLLPTFEALMALTNLASTDDDTRVRIVRLAWDDIEEKLLNANGRVATAAVELVCNLVQSPEAALKYADGSPRAQNRLHILVALADAEDAGTRSGAGGALASLTNYESVVRGVVELERGVAIVLGMCDDDESEDLRHRGAFVMANMLSADGETGRLVREKAGAQDGVAKLTECARKSRRPEVVEITAQALKILIEGT